MKKMIFAFAVVCLIVLSSVQVLGKSINIGITSSEAKDMFIQPKKVTNDVVGDIPKCGHIRIILGTPGRFNAGVGLFGVFFYGVGLNIYEGGSVEIRGLMESSYTTHEGPWSIGLTFFYGDVKQNLTSGEILSMSGYYFGTLIKP
jgi:hypothetical protein